MIARPSCNLKKRPTQNNSQTPPLYANEPSLAESKHPQERGSNSNRLSSPHISAISSQNSKAFPMSVSISVGHSDLIRSLCLWWGLTITLWLTLSSPMAHSWLFAYAEGGYLLMSAPSLARLGSLCHERVTLLPYDVIQPDNMTTSCLRQHHTVRCSPSPTHWYFNIERVLTDSN